MTVLLEIIVKCHRCLTKYNTQIQCTYRISKHFFYAKLEQHNQLARLCGLLHLLWLNHFLICDWVCENRACLHKLHVVRKWEFSWSLLMINMFCKFLIDLSTQNQNFIYKLCFKICTMDRLAIHISSHLCHVIGVCIIILSPLPHTV